MRKTPLKKKTPLKSRSTRKRKLYSVLTNDLDKCIITGYAGPGVEIHHIFCAANKKKSEIYGFVIPLRWDWHTLSDYSIHQDRQLDLEYKRKCQDYWLQHYGTKEQFVAEFGKWW